jgi:hypothetical protein
MENYRPKRGSICVPLEPERLLESHYSQLLKWAILLTRGDMGIAQDIV